MVVSLWDKDRVERYLKMYGDPREKVGTQSILCRDVNSMLIGRNVLDVGCGVGHLCPYIKPTSYFGIDSSPAMLTKAKEFFPEYGFREMNATVLDVPSRFDSVVAISLLIHLSDDDALKVLDRMWDRARKVMVFGMETMNTSEVIRQDGIRIRNQSLPEVLTTLEELGVDLNLTTYSHQKYTYNTQQTIIPSQMDGPLFSQQHLIQRTTIFRAEKEGGRS